MTDHFPGIGKMVPTPPPDLVQRFEFLPRATAVVEEPF